MFRTHSGPFPLSNRKSPPEIIHISSEPSDKLTGSGIWQFVYPPYWTEEEGDTLDQTQLQKAFKSIDVAFDLLESKCSFLPQCIRQEIRECVEPLYVRVYFGSSDSCGRGMHANFEFYEHGEWLDVGRIFTNYFCDEDEGEYLRDYEYVWNSIHLDERVLEQFEERLHCNTDESVTELSPDFDERSEYEQYLQDLEDKKKALSIEEGKKRKKGKRKLEEVLESDNDAGCPPAKRAKI